MELQPNQEEALLSVEEVARRLDVHEVTVYRWCRSGRLRCSRPGKSWWVREIDLAAFLEQSHQPGTLTEHLDKFFAVPDHVFAVVEDSRLLEPARCCILSGRPGSWWGARQDLRPKDDYQARCRHGAH